MKRIELVIAFFIGGCVCGYAQTQPDDSLRQQVRSYVARNFSEIRTFNFSWQASPAHTYRIKTGDQIREKGEMHSQNTIKFNTTLPVVLTKKFSLYAIGQADFYNYNTQKVDGTRLFSQEESDNNQYYRVTLNGMYRTSLAGKPLILNGNLSVDGYNYGVQQVLGTLAGVSILKRTRTTSLSAGLAFIWPFDKVPVMPVITYWHQFNPHWSVDVSMPRQFYFRYQLGKSSRISAGSVMQNDQYYFRSQGETRFFSETSLNTELFYEYVAAKHFYFFARAGITSRVAGGIYKPNRKKVDGTELSYHRKTEPFFTVGFSYNLYK